MTARLLAFALVAAGALQIAAAQSRSVRGTVTDRTGEPLKGAIVNVKNPLSLHVRSYVTQADGQYRFYGLHRDIDYEVRAKYRGQAGKTKTLHWYDSRREARIDLKVRVDRDAPPDTGANSKTAPETRRQETTMTSAPIVTGHEPANDDLSVRDAMSYVSNQRLVKHRALSRAATALKWAGHFVAGVALMFVFSGSGLWTFVVAIAGALVGTLASALANKLGLPGSLEGVRVENVLTPVCLSVPYYARIRDLPKKHPPYGKDCCLVVVRDGHALGIHVGADVPAGAAGSSSDTTVEQQMQPVSWVEAVEIDEDAIGALERMKRYRRSFLPVLKRHRLVGIIHRDRVLEAAQLSQSRARGARRDGVKK